MPKTKKNFVKKTKFNFKKEEGFTTVFHLGLSSKAVFELSEPALKLYILFVLHGKKNPPSLKLFAGRMKKSERTVSRYYEELKEKGFLKITCINTNTYKYEFDFNGNVDVNPKEKIKLEENQYIEEKADVPVEVFEKAKERLEESLAIQKSKTIKEYEDFAILENIFWQCPDKDKKQIIDILEERSKNENLSREAIDWFLNKVKYV